MQLNNQSQDTMKQDMTLENQQSMQGQPQQQFFQQHFIQQAPQHYVIQQSPSSNMNYSQPNHNDPTSFQSVPPQVQNVIYSQVHSPTQTTTQQMLQSQMNNLSQIVNFQFQVSNHLNSHFPQDSTQNNSREQKFEETQQQEKQEQVILEQFQKLNQLQLQISSLQSIYQQQLIETQKIQQEQFQLNHSRTDVNKPKQNFAQDLHEGVSQSVDTDDEFCARQSRTESVELQRLHRSQVKSFEQKKDVQFGSATKKYDSTEDYKLINMRQSQKIPKQMNPYSSLKVSMDQSKENMMNNSQVRESSSFIKNYKLSENILQEHSQKDSQMNSVASSKSLLTGNPKSPSNTQIKPAKSAFLTNEAKGEQLSEESSKSNKKGKSGSEPALNANASNYSDQIRDALEEEKFSESHDDSESKKDENQETSTENVYSIFSNHWEKQYKVSDSLRQIFGNSSVDSKMVDTKNLFDIKGSFETNLNNDVQSVSRPHGPYNCKFRSNSDAQKFSDGEQLNQLHRVIQQTSPQEDKEQFPNLAMMIMRQRNRAQSTPFISNQISQIMQNRPKYFGLPLDAISEGIDDANLNNQEIMNSKTEINLASQNFKMELKSANQISSKSFALDDFEKSKYLAQNCQQAQTGDQVKQNQMQKPSPKDSGTSVIANKSTQVEEDILRPTTMSLFHGRPESLSLDDSSHLENQFGQNTFSSNSGNSFESIFHMQKFVDKIFNRQDDFHKMNIKEIGQILKTSGSCLNSNLWFLQTSIRKLRMSKFNFRNLNQTVYMRVEQIELMNMLMMSLVKLKCKFVIQSLFFQNQNKRGEGVQESLDSILQMTINWKEFYEHGEENILPAFDPFAMESIAFSREQRAFSVCAAQSINMAQITDVQNNNYQTQKDTILSSSDQQERQKDQLSGELELSGREYSQQMQQRMTLNGNVSSPSQQNHAQQSINPNSYYQQFMVDYQDPQKLLDFIQTKQGSKDLQKMLAHNKDISVQQKLEIEQFVDFIVSSLCETNRFAQLLMHQYGNYFCQKLFQRLNNTHKEKLLESLMEKIQKEDQQGQVKEMTKFRWVSQDSKGTHSLQAFIEILESGEFKNTISSLLENEGLLKFAFNKHATHVLIKYVEITPEDPYLFKIYQIIANNFTELSMDANGLPLVKKCLSWIRTPYLKSMLRAQLTQNAVKLAQNAYGNYSLQVAFDNWPLYECKEIFETLRPELLKLSVQKFSSNVIEKIIDLRDQETIIKYSHELNKPETLKILIKNNYGFYVLERILNQCQNPQIVQSLMNEIQKGLQQLIGQGFERDPYMNDYTNTSMQLKQKWNDLIQKINSKHNNNNQNHQKRFQGGKRSQHQHQYHQQYNNF